ncbi:PREDICTED: putative dynamin-related protein 4A [Camelina sativa]|uniref:Dynamin-related protein 4A n=1 Tax=Camelina sativa TaxID=90675 RepID=A0ABM0WQ51_CAMSA|nr:PREDICTED: putative dynamin-related protein 4A [Camelina sativa]
MQGSKIPNVDEPDVEAGMASPSLTNEHEPMASPSLADEPAEHNSTDEVPIVPPNNDHLHNIVEGLSNLNLGREGIQRPTIVLVGGHDYGMSSVLESLARLSFRGKGQSTRVPLVVKLQKSSNPVPEIYLEYKGKVVTTDEEHIANAIGTATDEIAGSGEGVSDIPLTLHVKKTDVPDLTLVDLPGLRIPVDGIPKTISTKIYNMIKKFIKQDDSIILNILPATVDFTTCESILMAKKFDKKGERTLTVVTKADIVPEGLLEKLSADNMSIGFGYVCIRNRVGDESFDEARKEEELLFSNNPLLSLIDKNIVGIPVLVKKLKQIQEVVISRLAAKPPLRRSTRSKFLNPYLR